MIPPAPPLRFPGRPDAPAAAAASPRAVPGAAGSGALQPLAPAALPKTAPHVAAALARHAHPYARPVAAGGVPVHLRAALDRAARREPGTEDGREAGGPGTGLAGAEYTTYDDRRALAGPVAPPRRPVYVLRHDDGRGCTLTSVETGRTKQAGDLFAGFVRMTKEGDVYVSPRTAPNLPGDSHPSIASATPEGRAGRKSVVAAGEIGIRGGEIVGHNDKTGHYQTRKNKTQSGLPAESFKPYTVNAAEWYGRG